MFKIEGLVKKVLDIPEKSGPTPLVPRRSVLGIMAVATVSAGVLGYSSLSFSPETDEDMLDIHETEKPLDDKERKAIAALGKKLEVTAAACTVIVQTDDRNLKNDLLVRHGLNEEEALTVAASEYEKGFGVGDVGIILRAIEVKGEKIEHGLEPLFNEAFIDNNQGVVEFATDPNKDASDWKEFIEKNELVEPMLRMGTRGKNALERFGFDIKSVELQSEAAGSIVVDRSKLNGFTEGCKLIEDQDKPHNSVVLMGKKGEEPIVYTFDRSRSPEEVKWAIFVLKNIGIVTDGSLTKSDYDLLQTREFITFQTWVYDYYREKLATNPKMTLNDFYLGIHDDLIKETKYPEGHFIEKLKLIEAEYSMVLPKEYRYSSLTRAANWDIQQFTQMVQSLSPKTRSMFHEKETQLQEPRTYQTILAEASKGGLTREKLVDTAVKYAGNLFLEPIVERVASDRDLQIFKSEGRLDPRSVMQEIINERMTLMQHADKFFGESRKFVLTNSGDILGVIVTDKIAESVTEIPANVLNVLRAVEGDNWLRGGDFLKRFIVRNLVARFRKDPESGASSPEMTIFEAIFPGPFDKLSSIGKLDKKAYAFRRTDLYGRKYLEKLYIAYRDGKPMPELYEHDYLNSPMTPKDPPENIINKICSKIETAILTRDFVSHFGKEALIDLLAKYVPMGSARGVQIYGLEAGANYVFNKSLKDLNDGEAAILIGMISSPNRYGPLFFDGKRWKDNDIDCKERAETVARLCRERGGFDISRMKKQIEEAVLTKTIKSSWITSFTPDQINKLAQMGVLSSPSIKIGSGINVIRLNEAIPFMPEVVGMPRYVNAEQSGFEDWFGKTVKPEEIKLVDIESSPIADVLQRATEIISGVDMSGDWKKDVAQRISEYARVVDPEHTFRFITSRLPDGKIDRNRNEYPKGTAKYDLFNQLYELETTKTYQCGQMALVLNALVRLKTGISAPTMLGPGNVDTWIDVLYKESWKGQTAGYYNDGRYQVISLDSKILGNQTEDPASLLEVGDMVVGWMGQGISSGHVSTVVGKGNYIDRDGIKKSYIQILDANYQSGRGQLRRQIILSNKNLPGLLYPGDPLHLAVIRPKDMDHGTNVKRDDNEFFDSIFQANINGTNLVVPGLEQELMIDDGTTVPIVTPSFAAIKYDNDGFVKAIDPTNVLSTLPVQGGNPIKVFLHAYLKYRGLDTKQRVHIKPSNCALDGSDIEIRNAAAVRMNMDPGSTITLDDALSGSFDVPHQTVFKQMLDNDPNEWNRFQEFLGRFGAELVGWDGRQLEKPPAVLREAYVSSLGRLGFAMTSFLNIDKYLPDIMYTEVDKTVVDSAAIKEAAKETKEILLNDDSRRNLKIGAYPIMNDIGNDPLDQAISNATVDMQVNGKKAVYIGTRSPYSDSAVLIVPETGEVVVSVSESPNKDTKLATIYRRASAVGEYGFAMLTTQCI